MGPALTAGARFRQRKISVKQSLQVLRQKDIPDFDIEDQQREIQQIETGVEKGEEEEHHLQQVINASAAKFKGAKVEQVYIPTPDASKVWPEAEKYYHQKFVEPDTYIKFSATVEDVSGCTYNLDERDEDYLLLLNKKFNDDEKCTEDEFELVCDTFDKIVDKRQPFLTMDPQQILSYDEIKSYALEPIFEESNLHFILAKKLKISPEKFRTLYDTSPKNGRYARPLKKLLELFGPSIYEHWKNRRIERGGKPVFPTIRFEDPSQKDDNNPYTSFRRREFRQARKTRRTDVQSIEKLKMLHRDLTRAENLLLLIAERELKKSQLLQNKLDTFTTRNEMKLLIRDQNLQLKPEEIDDLFIDKPQKKRLPIGYVPPPPKLKQDRAKARESSSTQGKLLKKQMKNDLKRSLKAANNQSSHVNNNDIQRPPQTAIQPYVKLPASKIPDIELTTVNTVLKDKLEGIKKAVSDKLIKRKIQDEGWVNFTDDPYNPYFDISPTGDDIIEDRTHFPYSSILSSTYEVENSREINFSHIFNNNRHYSNNDPDIVKINCFTGQVIKNDRHSILPEFYDIVGDLPIDNHFADSKESVEERYFEQNRLNVSEVKFKLRKRQGRGGRVWIDRKRIVDDELFDEYLNMPSEDEELEEKGDEKMEVDESRHEPVSNSKKRKNAYDCSTDFKKRLKSRFMFDSDLPMFNPLDPSKLNQISKQTQAIRFGCMLLTKSYDNMHQIRQKQMMQQQQKLHQQQLHREKMIREQREREKLRHQEFLKQQQRLQQEGIVQRVNSGQSVNGKSQIKEDKVKITKEKKAKKEMNGEKKNKVKKNALKTANKNAIELSNSPVKVKVEAATRNSDKSTKDNQAVVS
ncbi:hypothetical protein CANINC_000549 [Pichia inconspicua]|uniref:Enhancer of polycomb-like protein n=1 Tax=Pichia inconspicua TaxID=52247 RepID=A0A4V4NG76_9ASCO|nr:hypothetical protein CANINC_000549 [[Candida] inconspicua]